MFDVGGRIVLQDLFSNVLRKLQVGTKQADDAFESLGDQVDATAISATRRIQQLNSQIDALRQKSASGAQITIADVEKFRAAQSELNTITGTMEDITGATDRATSSMGGLGKAAIGVGTAFAALRFGQTIIDLTTLGAKAQTVQGIFSNLSENLGVDGAKLQRDLQQAARGTVDSVTLITTANRALLAGGAELAGKIPQLFEIARAASLATGQDINYVFETLVRGIVKASPLLIDNADIYIKIGDAVDKWAESQGKTNEQLTETERRMAIANAVISQGAEFMQNMGLTSKTSADDVQSLTTAFTELKRELGETLVVAGVVDLLRDIAETLGLMGSELDVWQRVRELRKELKGLGADTELDEFNKGLKELQREQIETRFRTGDLAYAQELFEEGLDDLVTSVNKTAQAYRDAINPETAFARAFKEGAETARESGDKLNEASEGLKAFNKYTSELVQSRDSVDAVAKGLAELGYELNRVISGVPEAPDLGTLLTTDIQALYDYTDALVRLGLVEEDEADKFRKTIQEFERQRNVTKALAFETQNADLALEILAGGILGAGASAEDLVDKFTQLSDAEIEAIIGAGKFGEAFARAVDLASSKAAGLENLRQTLVNAAGQFQALTDFAPGALKTPDIPKDLAFDPAPWYAYLDTIEQVGDAQDRLAAQSTRQVIRGLGQGCSLTDLSLTYVA